MGFRAWTAGEARRLGLCGWVRNRRDGSVEAAFSGPHDAMDSMLAACRQGPPAAAVERIEIEPAAEAPAAGFAVLATA